MRINLSEQTDLSDLMGSDLPVPEKNADGKLQASFKWCDGVLLTAIKNGDWVLLDELNLASQAVLEGLNSCLDYRASVFVPELGKTFDCPSTFRVFGAQNGMAEGGGRKGLPRSFLNRCKQLMMFVLIEKCFGSKKASHTVQCPLFDFHSAVTKVHVAPLSKSDLRAIGKKYPRMEFYSCIRGTISPIPLMYCPKLPPNTRRSLLNWLTRW